MRQLATSARRVLLLVGAIVVVWLSSVSFVATVPVAADSLPSSLSDQDFWRLIATVSEPNGFFRSDNLLSNEIGFQYVIPDLVKVAKPGRVYMGVGPEQNFTYIAALKPAMAFIVDVRRGNLELQLMYKALFELSEDRADFVARLFSKSRAEYLTAQSTAKEIFDTYRQTPSSEAIYAQNLQAIDELLTVKHGFPLTPDDLRGIEYVYHAFYWFGPRIQYSSSGNFGGPTQPSYSYLMTATDAAGVPRSYLSSEDTFAFLKTLENKNLLVPVVGNFAGSRAIRSVATYLKEKGATVSAFYLSNVEQYLRMDGIWTDFCQNVAALPLDGTSTFIRTVRRPDLRVTNLSSELGEIQSEVQNCK